jgi:hypothetical protein
MMKLRTTIFSRCGVSSHSFLHSCQHLSCMVEVEDMNMVEKRPSNHQPEDEGMDMVDEYPSKGRPEVGGMDMVEDMTWRWR